MKVKDLVKLLAEFDQNAEVIVQKDGEGNGYSPLYGIEGGAIYVAESSWHGSIYDANCSADDVGMEEHEWDAIKKNKRCVVLTPVN